MIDMQEDRPAISGPMLTARGRATRERIVTAAATLMHERGELEAEPDALAAGLLAAVQGGLLLAQATGSVRPLEAALDLALSGVAVHLLPTTGVASA